MHQAPCAVTWDRIYSVDPLLNKKKMRLFGDSGFFFNFWSDCISYAEGCSLTPTPTHTHTHTHTHTLTPPPHTHTQLPLFLADPSGVCLSAITGVDVFHLPLAESGNQYVVIFLDYLTKWVEAFVVPDHSATTIAKLLAKEVFCRHGAPEHLLSDRGVNFSSSLLQDVYRYVDIKKINTYLQRWLSRTIQLNTNIHGLHTLPNTLLVELELLSMIHITIY